MKKTLLWLVLLAAVGGGAYAYYALRPTKPKFTVATAAVSHGDVVETVGTTGTLQAVTTVQVGTQVSGTIEHLYADYNSLVKKGQVLARLDQSLFQTQMEQANANLIRSQADLERLRVALDDAKTKLKRSQELSHRQLIPQTDLETAEVNVRAAEAQLRSAEAQVTQAKASLNQEEVNIQHTVIEAPIDGLVISRSVDVGQTVAASMQAPTLFVLAADLTKMQVVANLDESDVGRIRPGQKVSFRVDAYAGESFTGLVSQVRLEPKVQNNVVTYATVIDVPNKDLKLKPGMTANVNIEIARAADVLRVPNGAIRFRPTAEIYAALGQSPPDPARARAEAAATRNGEETGASKDAGRGARGSETVAAARADSGAAGGERSDRRGRMQNLSDEERQQLVQRMRARGGDAAAPTEGRGGSKRGREAAPAATAAAPATAAATLPAGRGTATTIDALFGPLPRTESSGRAWQYVDKQLKPVRLRLGISDGQNTEVLEGDIQQGTPLVTSVITTAETRPAASAFPGFGQPQRGGPFPGGGAPRGGGGARGGGR